MKKVIFIAVSLLVVACGFYYSSEISNRLGFGDDSDTSSVFSSASKTRHSNYGNDSLAIFKQLNKFLLKQENFFDSKEYFSGTTIMIDTIVYSPDGKRLAILILTKNPVSRQMQAPLEQPFYYNATSYLGIRYKDSIRVRWLGPNFKNSGDRRELSRAIRETFFRKPVPKESRGVFAYKYNLNDHRFWTSNLWQEEVGNIGEPKELQKEEEQ